MSKFLQLADDIESDLREMDSEADELNAKRLKNKELSREIFNGHHSAQDRVHEGLKKMEQVMKDMSGSNSSKASTEEKKAVATGEGSETASDASFPKVGTQGG